MLTLLGRLYVEDDFELKQGIDEDIAKILLNIF